MCAAAREFNSGLQQPLPEMCAAARGCVLVYLVVGDIAENYCGNSAAQLRFFSCTADEQPVYRRFTCGCAHQRCSPRAFAHKSPCDGALPWRRLRAAAHLISGHERTLPFACLLVSGPGAVGYAHLRRRLTDTETSGITTQSPLTAFRWRQPHISSEYLFSF
jgi:hypothetical protein